MSDGLKTYRGGCHCGEVAFEFDLPPGIPVGKPPGKPGDLPDQVVVQRCNCSICAMTGFLHLIVPGSRFRLTRGKDSLVAYQFNTRVANHYFCGRCGVKSFYVPRSNPDGFSVNYRCVEGADLASVTLEDFDGRNWEANAGKLSHLSRE